MGMACWPTKLCCCPKTDQNCCGGCARLDVFGTRLARCWSHSFRLSDLELVRYGGIENPSPIA